ncbi:MAG: ATP-binding cassette domain-containing protein [Planctomycetota bacterium]|nr:ATP-binding cassette domain-containing protein [Planctomycetota bacterium]
MAAISVQDLAIGFGGSAIQEHLTFQVGTGEVFLILGGSGCGKSTLLRHLIGLQAPMAGSIEIAGIGDPLDSIAGKPAFGVMFQSGALFGSMTLAQNVGLPLRRWTNLELSTIETIVRWKLRLVGLDGFENHLPSEISGGMKKRAGIARAMALETNLLFLDEPSAGLDPVSAVELDELILTLSAGLGMTIVIVTHELESIFKIGSRCIMLDKEARGIIAEGDPRVLRDDPPNFKVRTFFRRLPAGGI